MAYTINLATREKQEEILNKVNAGIGVVKSIQRGVATTKSGDLNRTVSIPISTVIPSKCMVVLNGNWSITDSTHSFSDPYVYSLTSNTLSIKGNYYLSQDAISSFSWQLIEFY